MNRHRRSPRASAMLLALLALPQAPARASEPVPPNAREVAARLLAEETLSQGAWTRLEWLTDRIGHRLSGSPGAERAVAWALEQMQRDGLESVHPEPVWVPRWVRGAESFALVAPVARPLSGLGLGNSEGTPPEGVSGFVVEVADMDDLHAKQHRIADSIVFFNKPIVANGGARDGYGAAAKLRGDGPSAAARLGARGMLIRSLATASLNTPHTGATSYEYGVERIPAAALSVEDAELLHRLLASGDRVEVCMKMDARMLDDVPSANVVGELRGRELPEQIVLIGGHLDSWDVGQGAVDDGAGVVMAMESLRLLRVLGLRPRRTIRAVLFMNEENGLRGGLAYAAAHAHEADRHVAAIESDTGAARPIGFPLKAGPGAVAQLEALLAPLAGLGPTPVMPDESTGVDLLAIDHWSVPQLGLRQDMTHYFDWHHSESDTLDKVVPAELTANVVAMAYAAWALAEAEVPLPRRPARKVLLSSR